MSEMMCGRCVKRKAEWEWSEVDVERWEWNEFEISFVSSSGYVYREK